MGWPRQPVLVVARARSAPRRLAPAAAVLLGGWRAAGAAWHRRAGDRHARRSRVRTTQAAGRRRSGAGAPHLCPSDLDAQRSRKRRSGADARRWEAGASGVSWLLGVREALRAVTHLCSSAAALTFSSVVKTGDNRSSVFHGNTEARNLKVQQKRYDVERAPAPRLSFPALWSQEGPRGPEQGGPSVTDGGGERG